MLIWTCGEVCERHVVLPARPRTEHVAGVLPRRQRRRHRLYPILAPSTFNVTLEPSLRVRRSSFASSPADSLPPAMKSLRLALPRSAIYRTLTGSDIGRRIVRIASFAPVKASSGAKVTSVSCSDIAPVPEARPSLRRTPPLAWPGGIDDVEEKIEKVIYKCRFFAFLAVAGSLMGSIICFVKGCTYVINSFREYFVSGGKVILMLVEAIDVYLVGTVMLVFGMGLYELFISNLDIAKMSSHGSNLLGLFKLMERPRWLEIQSVNELKTKLGHVIVMVLLVGMFEKSKKVTISTPTDLLYFAASILLSSGCLYLLSKLQSTKRN